MDWIDRLYERLNYPWWLHPLLLLWVVLPCSLALIVGMTLRCING